MVFPSKSLPLLTREASPASSSGVQRLNSVLSASYQLVSTAPVHGSGVKTKSPLPVAPETSRFGALDEMFVISEIVGESIVVEVPLYLYVNSDEPEILLRVLTV